MMLSKIKEFYTHHKKEILYFVLFGFVFFYSQDTAFAAGDAKSDGGANKDAIVEIVTFIVTIASSLIALLSGLVSLLLHPGWVNGTILGFDIYLKEIWILISNIVYFIFAFLLIAIAFMNIIGKGENVWELKQALPKFVIGVLIVPFSWFFVQFVLSLSALLTVSVLSIPYDTMNGSEAFKAVENKKICTSYLIDLTQGAKNDPSGQLVSNSTEGSKCSLGEEQKSVSDILKGGSADGISSSVFGMINVYTYGIMKIDQLNSIKGKNIIADLITIADLGLKVIFDLLFIVVYMILMVALFMALFARATWLWIHAMFSPVYGLLYFFGKAKDGVGDQKFGVGEFIKLALIPVYVSAALAFGLVFIFVAANGLTKQTTAGSAIFQKVSLDGNATISSLGKDGKINTKTEAPAFTMGGFTLAIKGTQGGTALNETNEIFSSLGNGLGQLILELFGLAILWIALMTALKGSEITGKIIAPIEQFGKSVGSLVAKSPQYAPIIPTGKGGLSMQGLAQVGKMPQNALDSRVSSKADKFKGPISSMFGAGTPALTEVEKTNIRQKWTDGQITRDDFKEINSTYVKGIENGGRNDSGLKEDIKGYIMKLKADGHHNDILNNLKEEDIFKNNKLNENAAKVLLRKGLTDTTNDTTATQELIRQFNLSTSDGGRKNSSTSSPSAATANAKATTKVNIKSISDDKLTIDVKGTEKIINEDDFRKKISGKKDTGGNDMYSIDWGKLKTKLKASGVTDSQMDGTMKAIREKYGNDDIIGNSDGIDIDGE